MEEGSSLHHLAWLCPTCLFCWGWWGWLSSLPQSLHWHHLQGLAQWGIVSPTQECAGKQGPPAARGAVQNALGEWLWLKAQLQGLACAVWVCSCEQCPAVGHAADLLQKPDWQLGSVQSRQRGISVSGGRFHLPWIGIGLP